MNEKDETRLRDMLDAAQRAVKFVDGKTREALEEDNMLLGFALVRAIEVVGEAANQVAKETRETIPNIRWREMIGMRNRIVHNYVSVDYDIVWTVATVHLPEMIIELEKALAGD